MKHPGKSPKGRKGRATIEWIGGIVSLPSYVTGEGAPFRPEALLWKCMDFIVGMTVDRPGELLGKAGDNLRETIEKPMMPVPAPTRVRVDSPALAERLQAGHPGLDIVCGPTPELEEVIEHLRKKLQDDAEVEQTYLVPGMEPKALASFFRAVAALYRAKPWKAVPADEVISLTVPTHGFDQAVLSVIGQMGENFGFLIFASMADFDAYLEAADAIERGGSPQMPSFLVLNYERRADIDEKMLEEISSHGWEVADPRAYPFPALMGEDMVARPTTAKEIVLMEAVALALIELTKEKKALRDAFAGGEPMSRTCPVRTWGGEVPVTLRVPHEQWHTGTSEDLLSALCRLEEDGSISDGDLREPLEEELAREFLASPEGKSVSRMDGHRWLMRLAADLVGSSIATLEPWGLREVLFEILPRKLSVEASAAEAIVEDCRAFYRFLKRAYDLEQADACLQALDQDATQKLEEAMADPRSFGMAKSLFMAGKDAGFDLQSEEGVRAWIDSLQSKPLSSVAMPGRERPDDKKESRRTTARKKNR
jgi:hypothetical protein